MPLFIFAFLSVLLFHYRLLYFYSFSTTFALLIYLFTSLYLFYTYLFVNSTFVFMYVCVFILFFLFIYLSTLHRSAVTLHALNVHIIKYLFQYWECRDQPRIWLRQPLHALYNGI
jgi:hypothetical protein